MGSDQEQLRLLLTTYAKNIAFWTRQHNKVVLVAFVTYLGCICEIAHVAFQSHRCVLPTFQAVPSANRVTRRLAQNTCALCAAVLHARVVPCFTRKKKKPQEVF